MSENPVKINGINSLFTNYISSE